MSYYINNKLPENLISYPSISHFIYKYAPATGIHFKLQYQENSQSREWLQP